MQKTIASKQSSAQVFGISVKMKDGEHFGKFAVSGSAGFCKCCRNLRRNGAVLIAVSRLGVHHFCLPAGKSYEQLSWN